MCAVEGRTGALLGVCSGRKNWSTVGCVQWKEKLEYSEHRTFKCSVCRHMRCIILPSAACPALLYFSTLALKRHDFLKQIENKMCVLIFCATLSEIFLILRRIQRDIITNVHKSSGKVPVIPAKFSRKWDYPNTFKKIINYQIS